MTNWLESIKEDLNQEEGEIVTKLTAFTSFLYKGVLFLAIPIFLYSLLAFI